MVKVGDKVRVTLADEDVKSLALWQADPTGMTGKVAHIDADDEFPVQVTFEKEDPEDTRQFPDFFNEDELEVVSDD